MHILQGEAGCAGDRWELRTTCNLNQATFKAGETAAASRAMPRSHSTPNSERAASQRAAGTLRRRQLYRTRAARKMAAASEG
jgi:hypothetical protein